MRLGALHRLILYNGLSICGSLEGTIQCFLRCDLYTWVHVLIMHPDTLSLQFSASGYRLKFEFIIKEFIP